MQIIINVQYINIHRPAKPDLGAINPTWSVIRMCPFPPNKFCPVSLCLNFPDVSSIRASPGHCPLAPCVSLAVQIMLKPHQERPTSIEDDDIVTKIYTKEAPAFKFDQN